MFIHQKPEIFVTVLVCLLACLDGYLAQSRRGGGRGTNRRGSQSGQGLPQHIQEAYFDAFGNEQVTEPTTIESTTSRRGNRNRQWNIYAPRLPSAADSDCEVVVQIEQIQRGRCVQLGGSASTRPFICQSGQHFDFRPECEEVIQNRQNRHQIV